jgi:isochorismate hydrolase
MPRKEKYLTTENLESEVGQIIADIPGSGGKERGFTIQGNPALLVADMQQYFLSPESHAFIPSAEAIIPNILKMIDHFNEDQYPVIYTQHFNDEDNAGNMKTWWRDLISIDSPLSSLSPLLPYPPASFLLKKTQYDAFHQTELENILQKNDIRTLIICGVMTNLCCETTLRSAFVRGFNAIMPVDATAAYKKEYHISTFVNLSFGFCPVKTTSEIIDLLNK